MGDNQKIIPVLQTAPPYHRDKKNINFAGVIRQIQREL